MSGEAQWQIQQAVHARLAADAGIIALVGTRIHDAAPAAPVYPYIMLGETFVADWDTKSFDGVDVDLVIHVWSRYRCRKEAKEILAAIHASLHAQVYVVTGNNLVLSRFRFGQVFLDADGLTRHGTARYRIVTHS